MFQWFRKKTERPAIQFFNTLTKKKELFVPLSGGRTVKMYTCGPTVYDYAHIGNLRSFVFADIIKRILMYRGYSVKHVINITDVGHLAGDSDQGEDKMTSALHREGKTLSLENMKALGEVYAETFIEDVKLLNITLPFLFPRASDHIQEQIAFVKTLIEKGYAYEGSEAVYFDTTKFASYGALGGSASAEHSRIGISNEKRTPRDFTLWKKDAHLGWESPWGKGFPGWHIECTAMSIKYLGKSFDIHTGGVDHIPVHHNNEIAQSEAATGRQFVRYWLHGEFISVDGRRIGKSEGNAIRLYQLIERGISPLAYRYLLLGTHYRQQMNFTWGSLEAAHTTLYRALRMFADLPDGGSVDGKYRARFEALIDDDANTPEALALLWELLKDDSIPPGNKRATILDFDRVLGLGFGQSLHRGAFEKLSPIKQNELPETVAALVRAREEARQGKQWAEADRLREELSSEGFSVEDTKEGPRVHRIG